jgi:hypothetical protein
MEINRLSTQKNTYGPAVFSIVDIDIKANITNIINKAHNTMFIVATIFAAFAIPASGCPGKLSVIFKAPLAIIKPGIESNGPIATNEIQDKTKANVALVEGYAPIPA